ncbi:Crp/Fnr family transcriptional regulator [Paenibacillus turpanensis]|uniref:Crp/Fnr family transcriptional regulator n=1 Tax=Paenibacillus turpanensis TaxID=2689078 RepID=UPI00140E1FDC|nr:Crp/Fnr family transcriptional regulator [Paenibacillus turpanensis]
MINYLQRAPLFSGLTHDQLQTVASASSRRVYPAGTLLFREKEHGSTLFIVVSGSVKIFTTGTSGSEKILSVFHSGDCFGELSLIDGKPRSASAQTLEDSSLILLKGDDFLHVLQANFDISLSIMRELSSRLRDTNQHIHDLTFLDARTLVIKSLIRLANKGGSRQGTQISFKTSLNYDELSDLAGVSKSALMEVIRDLEERAILKPGLNEFTLDLTKLR